MKKKHQVLKNDDEKAFETEGAELCEKCGSELVIEEGEKICPDCDTEIDFFGEEDA
jgi:uncharacterized Zn finger protein (UPF0148 family)